jgi:cytoskeletal protein CcmA (bactofilin family)
MKTFKNKKMKRFFLIVIIIWYLIFISIIPLTILLTNSKITIGENVHINKETSRNLVVFGENISFDESINNNLITAGENIEINSVVDGNLFLGGENLAVNNQINGKFFVGGESLNITENAEIRGDAWINVNRLTASGDFYDETTIEAVDIEIKGNVYGDLNIVADSVVIGGNIEGKLKIKANRVEFLNGVIINELEYDVSDLKLTEQVVINSQKKMEFNDSDLVPEVEFNNVEEILIVVGFVVKLIILVTLYFFFKNNLLQSKNLMLKEPLKVAKKGLILQFGLLGIIILSVITIIGIPLGILLSIILWIGWEISLSFFALIVAFYLQEKFSLDNKQVPQILTVIMSFIVLFLIFTFIDITGFLYFLMGTFTFGAVYLGFEKEEESVI